jgi:hypothetical protein
VEEDEQDEERKESEIEELQLPYSSLSMLNKNTTSKTIVHLSTSLAASNEDEPLTLSLPHRYSSASPGRIQRDRLSTIHSNSGRLKRHTETEEDRENVTIDLISLQTSGY